MKSVGLLRGAGFVNLLGFSREAIAAPASGSLRSTNMVETSRSGSWKISTPSRVVTVHPLGAVYVAPEAVVAGPDKGLAVLERVVDEAIAALSAEAVGAMAALHALTVDYLKTRKQFGVPIGSFQVLQHRAVDMLTAVEQARSMAFFATMMAAEDDARERRKAMSAAKVHIGRSAKCVGQEAIQLHGGIGMTMEYKAGHYFKRLTMIDMAFGDTDHHLRELARMGGLT